MKMKGRITSLQRMSIHDGPGIRTVVFLKGCNMRCKWCHNPETWSFKPQIQYIQEKCIHCGTCIAACPQKAITPLADQIQIDYSLCATCGTCAASCCTQAISVVGEVVDIETLWKRIEKDLPFFKSSGGGITISGGEPLLQKEFVKEFLMHCKEHHIHTAIETNLSVDWEVIEELIPWVDLWMCDFKLFDSEKHKHWTGIDNQATIQNICRLGEKKIPTLVRTPIIPGVNDSEEEMREMTAWIAGLRDGSCKVTGSEIPLHISRFFPRFHMTDRGATDVRKKYRLADIAREKLKYVYTGNC